MNKWGKIIKTVLTTLAPAGYFGLIIIVIAALAYVWYQTKQPPEQPIAFSHRIHVGKVNLACDFCHEYADKSPRAGIPSVQKCMNCHEAIAVERPEIKKLASYWENQEPIPWVRVHKIPQRKYVYFTHKRHIKAGVECATCHGEVEVMDQMRKVRSLRMGWCVTCHRENSAPTDCLTCHK